MQQTRHDRRARPRCPWEAAGPDCGTRGRQRHHRQPNLARNLTRSFFDTPQKRCNSNNANSTFEQATGELRATLLGNHSGISNGEPTGVEGAGVSGGRKRARLRCPWAVAGPRRDTGPTGVEGAGGTGGPGCGARGRWQGLAGLRDDAPSKARGADGSRAGRRPSAHTAARPIKSGHTAPRTPAAPHATKTPEPEAVPGSGGGGWGIRTPEGLHPTRFPSVRHRPLGESSVHIVPDNHKRKMSPRANPGQWSRSQARDFTKNSNEAGTDRRAEPAESQAAKAVEHTDAACGLSHRIVGHTRTGHPGLID